MDLDALHRHMTEFKTLKPRILKMLEFVEGIMTSGMMPGAAPAAPSTDTSSAIVTSDQLGVLRQDVTVLDDRIDELEKFKGDVVLVLDQVPQFVSLMEKMQGFDPVSIEERLTAVEGSVQEIAAALDPTGEKPAVEASGSDGATPGQPGSVDAAAAEGAAKEPAPAADQQAGS